MRCVAGFPTVALGRNRSKGEKDGGGSGETAAETVRARVSRGRETRDGKRG